MSIALALLLAAHVCGMGPVTLSMTYPLDCPRVDCTIEQSDPYSADNYRQLCGNCVPGYGTWQAEQQDWTDWPEAPCNGAKL